MSGRYVISYRVFLFVGMAVVIYFSTALAATYTRDMTIPGDYTLSNSSLVEITNGVGQLRWWYMQNIVGDLGDSVGVAIGDIDNDGDLDIYVANISNQQNKLRINNGSGFFTAQNIVGDLGNSRGVVMGDIDNDGDLDIYVANDNGQNKLRINNGSGFFTAQNIAGDLSYSSDATMGDVDSDGDLDIYVANYNNQQNKLRINNGSGFFTAQNIVGDLGNSRSAVMGDIDNDGDLDIYVSNEYQQNRLWVNNGSGFFTSQDILGDTGQSMYPSPMGDIDSDGDLDIYVPHYSNQQNKLRINNGSGFFTAQDIVGDLGYSLDAVMGDIDNDGDLDIYVYHPFVAEQNKLRINNGSGFFTAQNIVGDLGNSRGGVMGDIDNDGDLDIYVGNGSNQQNRFRINGYSPAQPYIQSSTAFTFSQSIISFAETLGTGHQGAITYQVSTNNGLTRNYWDGSARMTTLQTNGSETSSGSAIHDHVATLDTDGGQFLWRAYLVSDGNQQAMLDQIDVEDSAFMITFSTGTLLSGTSITDTTITITDLVGISSGSVAIDPSSTAASQLICTQVDPLTVTCTVSVDVSGTLAITATNTGGQTKVAYQAGYIIDMIPPSVPLVDIDTGDGSLSFINNPTITFSATDNIAVDYFEILYTDIAGTPSTLVYTGSSGSLGLALYPTDYLLNFYHTIVVRVYDTAGNMTENEVSFPPIISFIVPTPISNSSITGATVTITSPLGNAITGIVLTSSIPTASLGTCVGSGSDTILPYNSPVTCTLTGIDSSGTVSISAYDFINLAQGKNAYTFLIDTIAPVIGIVAPQLTYTGNITTTTITITDDIALVTGDVTVSLIGVVGDLILQDVVCVQTYTSQVDCSLVVSSSSAGSGVLQVGVTDVAGNVMSALQTGYSIDTLGPLVNFSDNIEYTAYLTDTASLSVTDTGVGIARSTVGYALIDLGMGDTCDGSLIFVPYASGQVLTFDETHNDFSICVQAMDLYGNATYVTSAYPIAVTPNLPPTSLHLSPSIVNENTAVATTIIATDPDPSDTFGYSFCVSGADNTLFALSGDQLISSIILDYENPQDTDMNNVYDVCIEVMDSVGNIYQQILSLSVRDVSESISGGSGGGGGGGYVLPGTGATVTDIPITDGAASDTTTSSDVVSELEGAYQFAYDYGLTTLAPFMDADPYGLLLRKQLAKMMTNFAINVMGQTPDPTRLDICSQYIDDVSEEFDYYLVTACQLGIMGLETDGITPLLTHNFMADKIVTRAEFGTVLSRVLWGRAYDGSIRWYESHLQALKDHDYMQYITEYFALQTELRGNVWIVLQRVASD